MDVREPPSDRPARQSSRSTRQRSGVGRLDVRAESVEEFCLISEQFGLTNENRDEIPPGDGVQRGEHFVSDAISQQGEICIRRILERNPTELLADTDGLAASKIEDRVADASARPADPMHADQTVETGAPQKIDDDGFRSVVGRVSGAHVVGEGVVARASGARLQIRSGFDTNRAGDELCSDIAGSAGDEIRFDVRARTKPMVDVDRSRVQSGSSCKREQCEGICSSGHRADDLLTSRRKLAAREKISEEGSAETTEESSRFGDGSALVVAASLTSTRIAIRSDLLQITAAESGDSENADNRQHHSDPPVPHIRRKHGTSVAV